MWVGENESAKFWATVRNSLKNQGVEDIFIACTDNLTGFSAAIEAVYPKTEIQNCIIRPESTRRSGLVWEVHNRRYMPQKFHLRNIIPTRLRKRKSWNCSVFPKS